MKIGILTHPQGSNYGGLLQCYALSSFLRKQGHQTIVIHREKDRSFFLWEWIRSILRFFHFPRYYSPQQPYDSLANIIPFIDREINRTKPIRSQRTMRRICGEYGLDAVIVGSDQVWRKDFAIEYGYNYFLDFVPSDVKKISYAASLGLNKWEYDNNQTKKIKQLLSCFDKISVREEEAIRILCDNLNINAELMIDPTLLLTSEEYDIIASPKLVNEKYVFVYWLGEKSQCEKTIEGYISKGYKVVYVGLKEKMVLPSVGDWLSYIKYSDVVVTDSFHGCVFTLLYRRPLDVYENKSGGFGRIKTLFKLLGIDNGLHLSQDELEQMDNNLNELRNKSRAFLSL